VAWPREGSGGGELRPGTRKTAAIHAIRAVGVEVNGQQDTRERCGLAGAISVAGGGLTMAVASGGASGGGGGENRERKKTTSTSTYL
jgi:hypothetical protein